MIELLDTFPDTNVQHAEYKRLLGFPRDRVLEDRARDLAEWARDWYSQHGKPWIYARQAESLSITNGSITIDGVSFTSKRLQKTLVSAKADGAILVALSAGAEIEAAAQQAWADEKPDEYFFLEIFGSAVVEHLATMIGGRLCSWAETHAMAVLPHYSPGYPEWDIDQQGKLLELIKRSAKHPLPCSLEVLDSSMLKPKKSLLAVFGLTHDTKEVARLTDLVPCQSCSYAPCQFRRTAYVRPGELGIREKFEQSAEEPTQSEPVQLTLSRNANYGTNEKALKRWSSDRLKLTNNADGSVDALFIYEGTTCTNTGRNFKFHYNVKLGPREQGYPILSQSCAPAPGDENHRYMCRYMNNAEHLMVAITNEKPLLGQRLDDLLTWQRPISGAGCYCEPSSRKHKWGLVLETIHYALVQQEQATPA